MADFRDEIEERNNRRLRRERIAMETELRNELDIQRRQLQRQREEYEREQLRNREQQVRHEMETIPKDVLDSKSVEREERRPIRDHQSEEPICSQRRSETFGRKVYSSHGDDTDSEVFIYRYSARDREIDEKIRKQMNFEHEDSAFETDDRTEHQTSVKKSVPSNVKEYKEKQIIGHTLDRSGDKDREIDDGEPCWIELRKEMAEHLKVMGEISRQTMTNAQKKETDGTRPKFRHSDEVVNTRLTDKDNPRERENVSKDDFAYHSRSPLDALEKKVAKLWKQEESQIASEDEIQDRKSLSEYDVTRTAQFHRLEREKHDNARRPRDDNDQRLRDTDVRSRSNVCQAGSGSASIDRQHRIRFLENELQKRENDMREREEYLTEQERCAKLKEEDERYDMEKVQSLEQQFKELERREHLLDEWQDILQRRERSLEERTKTTQEPQNGRSGDYNQHSFPKFSTFSGEEPKPKSEASYEEWKYEVNCSRQDKYPEYLLSQAIRKSLRGQAKRVLLPMGISATVDEITDKLESIFGNVTAGETILQEFYLTSQRTGESAAAWGLRLEEVLQMAIEKGHVEPEKKNDMLRSRFWKGLKSEKLKNATRIHYGTVRSFELLRREVRAEEQEMKLASGIQHQPIRSEATEESKLDEMMKKMTALEKQIEQLNEKKQSGWKGRKRWNKKPDQGVDNPQKTQKEDGNPSLN